MATPLLYLSALPYNFLLMHRFIACFFLFFSLCQPSADAQTKAKWYQKFHPDSLINREVNLIPVPILQSAPETGIRAGFSLDYFFNTGNANDSTPTRDSFAWVQATYSTRSQLVIEPLWQIYTRNEKYLLRGQAGHTDFSEYFWGVGQEVLAYDNPPSLFYSRTYFQGEFLRQLVPNIFLGLQVQISTTRNITSDCTLNDLLSEVRGRTGSHTSGIGPNLIFDFRNNPFSPTKGYFFELSYIPHSRRFQSEYDYHELLVDARKYFEFSQSQFVGIQVLGHFSQGEVPLRELPRLGGSNIMRGMIYGRYRNNNMAALQAEYRKGLNRFLKIAAFGSGGLVSESFRHFTPEHIHYTYGLGLRILINKKKSLYSRIDIARSSEGNYALYFKLMDAF